ncbi:hypothetical protein [Actibacterium sp. MT2.3-13A]|uniref:hypothetical protein n=1 Tax=Actibacterium sp. MT2.3-13A TaxID=2828332 RepID=UPI001BABC586|nr:hypothetical protein [Actibacterium sp. MT2.3-13A]
MSMGLIFLLVVLAALLVVAVRQEQPWAPIVQRFIEQFAMLVPRMLMALMAAGFIAQLIPSAFISRFLGEESGFLSIVIASLAGIIVPAGPVIAFSIAAVFVKSGASAPALVAFLTSWAVFAAHRILIYEIPLLGAGFLRLRLASACIIPLVAGGIAMAFVKLG